MKNLNYQRDTTGLGYKEGQTSDIKGKAKVTLDILTRIWDTQSNSNEDESNDYEWDELSFTTEDKEINFIKPYSDTYHECTSSQLDSLDLIPHYATHNDHEESESDHEQDILDESINRAVGKMGDGVNWVWHCKSIKG